MGNKDLLATASTTKLLFKFSIPCVTSLLINALYNIVDQIFIGNSYVGSIGNTATSIIFPLTCLGLAIALMIGDGASAYMGLSMGRGKREKLPNIVGTSMVMGLVVSLVYLTFALIFLPQIVRFLGASTDEAVEKCLEYGYVIVLGFPFFILGCISSAIIRADRRPHISMIATLSGAITNVILDALFIFVFNLGLFGAALATILGQILSAIISIYNVFKATQYKLTKESFKPDFKELGQMLKLGTSSFLTQISIIIISVVTMNVLAKYGAESKYGSDDAQAIMGISMKVFSIFVNIAVGISVGAQPITSFNYGAKLYKRVKECYFKVLLACFIVGTIGAILFQLIPEGIIGLFGSNAKNPENYIELGSKTISIYLMLIPLTLMLKASCIFMQSIGKALPATIVSFTRDIITFVPFVIVLPAIFGFEGILYAGPSADALSFVVAIIFVFFVIRKINKQEKEQLKTLSE